MVRQWQELVYEKRESQSYMESLPNFAKLAESFGIKGISCDNPQELDKKLIEMIEYNGAVLFNCLVEKSENVFPMIPAGSAHNEILLGNQAKLYIQKDLNANMSQLQWVINGLVLALTVCSPIMGKIGDIYGRKTILYIGVIIFALSSAGAGISLGMNELIMFRIVQGVACAVLLTLSFSIVSDIFGPEHHGKALAVFGGITGTGLASGPVIGGIIASTIGWRYIFLLICRLL